MSNLLRVVGLRQMPLEAVLWVVALLFPFFIDTTSSQHFTLCLFSNLGWDFCPGCGIGRSIAHLYHGELTASIASHPFGIPVVLVLLHRAFQLIKNANTNQ